MLKKMKSRFLSEKKLLVTITLAIFCWSTNAQSPDWLWAKSIGGSDLDYANSVTTDSIGNIFVTGYFRSPTITFGSFTLTNNGSMDMYLVKYTPEGNVSWAKSAGGNNDDNAKSVTIDRIGNIFVAGSFSSFTITFGSFTLTNYGNSGYNDMYLVKYSSDGNISWAKSAGGSYYDYANSVTTDSIGNIFVAGDFVSPYISFGSFTLNNNGFGFGTGDMYLVKYSPNGNIIWAKSAGGNNEDGAHSVTADGIGNVFVVGSFSSPSISFGSFTLTNNGSYDLYLVKYTPNGNISWAKSVGGSSYDGAFSVTTDDIGNIFVAGSFSSPTITFGSITLSNNSSSDMYLVKYSPNGNVIWAKSAGGSNFDNAYSVTADCIGNIFVTGYFRSPTITFGSFTLMNNDSSGNNDMFIVKYSLDGNVSWAKSAGGSNFDNAYSVTADGIGNIIVVGSFSSPTITFGTFTLTNNDTSGFNDMFVAKLSSITGIENIENENGISVFPNPANGKFNVTVENSFPTGGLGWAYAIYNMLGEKVYSTIINNKSSTIKLDISDQPDGMYIIKAQNQKNKMYKKILISH